MRGHLHTQSSNQNNHLPFPFVRLNCLSAVPYLTNQPVDYRIYDCAFVSPEFKNNNEVLDHLVFPNSITI